MQQTPAAIAWKRRENEFKDEKVRLQVRIEQLEKLLDAQERHKRMCLRAVYLICINPQDEETLKQFMALVKEDPELSILFKDKL